ncbi:hypothetical protein VC83_05268 [Pseudogymnoascus destructans]|nr:uncharacterized protein VC83_05268 [Pseudogymnoascus destructans]OAF57919.1 hypothetical protein VC83_05268 [Pseudogymnoascus destructans]
MALPAVATFEECADFSQTVAPFIPQLYELPQKLLNSYWNRDELLQLYIATNPLVSALALGLALFPIVWIVSEVNRNYSQVDRLWSILPAIFIGHFVAYGHVVGLDTERLDTLLVAVVIWSVRLTHNYWRRGGYSIGSEDYRWMIIKKKVNSWSTAIWPVFNIIFIAGMQLGLLLLISTPAYIQLLVSNMEMPISKVDTLFPRALVGLVLIEALADHQQWSFQSAKAKYRATAKVPQGYEQGDLERGFVVSGLFSLCRHPNFACEQAFWVVLYQWSCFNTDQLYNWTGIGALSLVCLFQGSTWLTEKVTAQKYPEYKEYQKRVSKFIPRMSHALPGDPVEQPSVEPATRSKAAGGKKGDKGQKGSKRN